MLNCEQIQRIPLNFVDRISHGNFSFPQRSLLTREGEGVRVFWDRLREPSFSSRWNPFATDYPFSTFTYHPVRNIDHRFTALCESSPVLSNLSNLYSPLQSSPVLSNLYSPLQSSPTSPTSTVLNTPLQPLQSSPTSPTSPTSAFLSNLSNLYSPLQSSPTSTVLSNLSNLYSPLQSSPVLSNLSSPLQPLQSFPTSPVLSNLSNLSNLYSISNL
ncbi:unnamed protein product [Coregonus sp. 'balchen']|nr:unnamed protein product [Coregonus sp. 'balchen']